MKAATQTDKTGDQEKFALRVCRWFTSHDAMPYVTSNKNSTDLRGTCLYFQPFGCTRGLCSAFIDEKISFK